MEHSEVGVRQGDVNDSCGAALLPGLPDDLATLCLLRLPRASHLRLGQVSRSWSALLRGEFYFSKRSQLGLAEPWLCVRFRDKHFTNTCRTFDPLTDTWHPMPPLPPEVRGVGSAVAGGKLYVLGGWREAACALSAVHCFDFRTHRWQRMADMATPRCYMVWGTIDDKIYVAAGMSRPTLQPEWEITSVEVYDPGADTWRFVAPMTVHSRLACAITHGGKLLVGGMGRTRPQSFLQVYDPVRDEWSALSQREHELSVFSCIVECRQRLFRLRSHLQVWEPEQSKWRDVGDAVGFIRGDMPPGCLCCIGTCIYYAIVTGPSMEHIRGRNFTHVVRDSRAVADGGIDFELRVRLVVLEGSAAEGTEILAGHVLFA
eukprot:jgi/Mesen1/3812/ME000206S02985